MDVNPRYKYIDDLHGGLSYYVLESEVFIFNVNFILKNENENCSVVPINGHYITFRSSTKEA